MAEKRVRFREEPQIVVFEDEERDTDEGAVLNAMDLLEGQISSVHLLISDPAVAAARRAKRRREQARAAVEEGGSPSGEPLPARPPSLARSLVAAGFHVDDAELGSPRDAEEEETAGASWREGGGAGGGRGGPSSPPSLRSEAFWRQSEFPLEPFNLDQERREGHFDEESGGWIPDPREEEEADAWADALEEVPDGAGASGRGVGDGGAVAPEGKQSGGEAGGSGRPGEEGGHLPGAEPDPNDLPDAERRGYLRTLVDSLRPGETVLDALRRVAREGRVERGGRDAAEVPGARHHGRRPRAAALLAAPLAEEADRELSRITRASDALVHGAPDAGLHSRTREELSATLATLGESGRRACADPPRASSLRGQDGRPPPVGSSQFPAVSIQNA